MILNTWGQFLKMKARERAVRAERMPVGAGAME